MKTHKQYPRAGTFLLLVFCLNVSLVSSSTLSRAGSADESNIFQLVNRERERAGLSDVQWDAAAATVARRYAERMADQGFFAHVDPDGNTAMQRAERSGLKHWSRIGENLFSCDATRGFTTLAVRGWMKSPSHRQNILDPAWTAAGVGMAEADDGTIYVVQIFIER
jgi:uncharacterized protein YkwD